MEAGQAQGGGTPTEGKMTRGWRLTKAAWALIRRDPTMISIALMGAGCGLAGGAAIIYFSGYIGSPTHSRGDLALAVIVSLYPMTFLSVFFNVALAGAAAASFDGRPIGVRRALGIAWKRVGPDCAVVAAGGGSGARLGADRLANPRCRAPCVLAARCRLEPGDNLRRAIAGTRGRRTTGDREGVSPPDQEQMGGGITGLASIGIWTVFVTIPVAILFALGLSVRNRDATAGAALIAIAIGAILLVSALSLATRQVFSVALYRYASGAPSTGGFAAADLEEPFRRRDGRD